MTCQKFCNIIFPVSIFTVLPLPLSFPLLQQTSQRSGRFLFFTVI